MGRMYKVAVSGVNVTAAQDFFQISPGANKAVIIHSAFIGQSGDAGDAEAEMLPVIISRYSGASGSGGTTPTPRPDDEGDAAYAGVVQANNTTVAGGQTMHESETFNVQAGWVYAPIPEERITISPGASGLLISLTQAPADAILMGGTVRFEEIG